MAQTISRLEVAVKRYLDPPDIVLEYHTVIGDVRQKAMFSSKYPRRCTYTVISGGISGLDLPLRHVELP
jgi:hypothetical protein